MDFMVFQAGKNDDGRRIDRILKTILPASPLSAVYKSLRKGLIKVNGRKVDAAFKVALGDEITVAQFLLAAKSGAESEVARESERVKKNIPTGMVVFRNEHLLILDKPYDVPVQPSADRTLVSLSALVQDDFLAQEKDASLAFRPGPLHRLDRKTTGLVAFSQSIDGARIFSGWIKNHALEKIYLGLVLGRMEQEESWVDKIEKNDGGVGAFHTVRIVEGAEPGGKSADTYAVPLSHGTLRGHDVTLVKFAIGSGRTHQIRSQSAAHGFPLLGDGAYGGRNASINLAREFFLHAHELSFPQCSERDFLGLPEKLVCPLSEDFDAVLRQCGITR